MTAQSKISKILLAAALGAGSMAYATEQNNGLSNPAIKDVSTNTVNTSALGQGGANNNNYVSGGFARSAAPQIIQRTPPIIKKGLFTDTVTTSTFFTREEIEYSPSEGSETKTISTFDGTLSLDIGSNSSKVSPSLRMTQNTNTYLETSVCEINRFFGTHCESTYKKINSKPSMNPRSPTSQPVAP